MKWFCSSSCALSSPEINHILLAIFLSQSLVVLTSSGELISGKFLLQISICPHFGSLAQFEMKMLTLSLPVMNVVVYFMG